MKRLKWLLIGLFAMLPMKSEAGTTNYMEYGLSGVTFSIPNDVSASSVTWAKSVAIDNTPATAECLDALVFCKTKTPASLGGISSGTLTVAAYGSADGGTTYTDGVTSGSGTVTLSGSFNLPIIGVMAIPGSLATYSGGPWSVAKGFGGVLPDHWGIALMNQAGGPLVDVSGQGCWYQCIKTQNF